jgi:predicted ATP-dependent serine protease
MRFPKVPYFASFSSSSQQYVDLDITLQQAEDVINHCQNTCFPTLSMSQPVSIMLEHPDQIKTRCSGLDAVLDGGLRTGRILEISGPPGSPKEKIVVEIACVFAKAEKAVLFVGNLSNTIIRDLFSPCSNRLRRYKPCCSPPVFTT